MFNTKRIEALEIRVLKLEDTLRKVGLDRHISDERAEAIRRFNYLGVYKKYEPQKIVLVKKPKK